MRTQTLNAISYSYDMLSFLFLNKGVNNKIREIYIFGSAVRGELEKKSDIDLFINCDKKDINEVNALCNLGITAFSASKDYNKWKILNFVYPFSVQVGKLEEWELKTSIHGEGLLLYSNKVETLAGERKVIFSIEYPKTKKGYIHLRRLLFGRDEVAYKEKGVVQAVRGKKISSTIFMVPKSEQTRFIDILNKEKTEFSMTEVIMIEG